MKISAAGRIAVVVAIVLCLASGAPSFAESSDTQDHPDVDRCERFGYSKGSEKHANCVFVLSKLKQSDKYLQVESFAKCFDSLLWATRCAAWYGRDSARDSIDEESVRQFNSL
jgi:hypothetical protein